MVVGYPGTGGETDADFEKGLADAVDVGGIVAVDGLLVHRFPQGTRFNVCGVESHTHCLYVVVGLAVGDCRGREAWVTPAAPPTAPVITSL